jgi:hypothetical protein
VGLGFEFRTLASFCLEIVELIMTDNGPYKILVLLKSLNFLLAANTQLFSLKDYRFGIFIFVEMPARS